ncbi:VTT domain-containing protein [Bowmanella sp. Y26]|uniref:TVP38/TMEM64 family protein n=1 Tax=Bowmanella yangjiangensis TaxID=2811230 RepID=UPI001BDD547E|nr:VTT domain-containing protein [Bowmanella yangjiangensis]MBT1063591.1 VTT domain-containing protein [Bowmanella yangjiangensis]
MISPAPKSFARSLFPALAWLGALLIIGWFVGKTQWLADWQPERFGQYLTGNTLHDGAVFVGMFALLSAVGLPRQLPAFIGGYYFGVFSGLILSTLAVTLGASLTLLTVRLMGNHLAFLKQRLPGKRLRDFLSHNTLQATVAVRLFPVGNNLAVNLLAGLIRLPVIAFLAGSFIGYLPQMLVFALSGAGLKFNAHLQMVLGAILLIVSSAIGLWLYRRSRLSQQTGTEQDVHAHV